MNVELFVHGVPNGESFWGKEEDRNYFGNFYSNSSDEVKFLVQTRSLNGKTYCCYNYLVYKNVIANDGRAGSYFGISLRLDAYCKDILNMYRILDTVYNVHVVGTLLKAEKANLKYVVSDFSSNPGIMEDIWNAISRLLQKAFTADSFVDLAAFPTNSGSCSAYNLYDCSGDCLMEIMKKTGIVAVSPYYPSSRVAAIEQQCNARIQAMQQQYNALQQANSEARAKERDEQKTSLSTLRDRSAKLEKEITEKDEQIRSRDAEISRLKANANRAEQIGKIEQIVGSIRKPIEELSTAFRALQPEGKKVGVKVPESRRSRRRWSGGGYCRCCFRF